MPDSPENLQTGVGPAGAGPTAPAGGSASDEPDPQLLGGRYRLEEHIADGGMASVWRARDEVLARTVAVKLLHEHLATDATLRERFRREAVAAARLTHPGIVGLYDSGSDRAQAWLVMELVEGATLRQVMDDLGRLPVQQAASICGQIARALAYAHERGLVHRDVKPANILVGDDRTAKVTDFGIVKAQEAPNDLTRTGTVLGTASYVAPEQLLAEPLSGACDQYALGCVLYEALTGQRPFTAESALATAAQRLEKDPPPPRAVNPDLPAELEAVITRAMARTPSDRYPSADALADALAPFAGEDGNGTLVLPAAAARRPPGDRPPHPTPPAGRRRPAALVALVIAAGLLLAIGVTVPDGQVWQGGDTDTTREGTVLSPVEVALFDPGGTGSEQRNAGDLPNLLDGQNSTDWQSVGYATPAFGRLKPGLGFWLDLGAPHAVDGVALRTTTPGIRYEIRVADEPASAPEAWERVGEQTGAEELSQVHFSEPVLTRYILVWVTGDLQADGSGRYRAGFSEMAVRGSAA